ncbi:MAG: VCBS repeat-containing protein [Planctomycetota bacterium]
MAPAFRFPGKGSAELAGVADVDGDGDVDLVAGACVYYARGPLRAAPTPSTLATYTGFVFDPRDLRDLDGDGDVDLVPTYVLEPVSRTMRPALGEAWVNQADGTFQRVVPPVPSPAIPAGYDVEVPVFVGDFDGDGAPDQVVPLSQGGSFSHMGLLLNNGSGQFRHAGAAAAPGLRMGWDDPAYRQPGNGHVDDLDGDGDLDLIATSEHASSGPFSTAPLRIEIYWNDGRGTFVPGPVVDDAQFQVAADFDGDGRKDLLSVSGGRVSFHLATGLASVPYGSAWALLQRPSPVTRGSPGLTVLDANDDGRPDVAVGGQLWCNTTPASMIGAASFVPASLGIEGDSLYAIDVDGDGRTDLVSYNPATSQFALRVYRRHSGDGAVLAASDFDPPVAHVGFGVWPVDADGDGDTDLLGDYLLRNVRLEPPTGGAVRQYGPATAGEAGVAPLLGAVGPFVPRSNVELRLSRVTGPTTGIIVVGVAEAALPAFPVPGVTLLVDPGQVAVQLWPVTEAGQGYAAAGATLPLRLIAAARGLEFFAQALVYDPAAPGSFAASNGVRFAVGQ